VFISRSRSTLLVDQKLDCAGVGIETACAAKSGGPEALRSSASQARALFNDFLMAPLDGAPPPSKWMHLPNVSQNLDLDARTGLMSSRRSR
jgi:hypothetical protein